MKYPAQKIGAKLYYSKTMGTHINKPKDLIRISLRSQSPLSCVNMKGFAETNITATPTRPQKNNLQIIERIQGRVYQDGNRNKLASALKTEMLVGASDGSVKNSIGSHAWMITKKSKTHKNKSKIYGAGLVDEHP